MRFLPTATPPYWSRSVTGAKRSTYSDCESVVRTEGVVDAVPAARTVLRRVRSQCHDDGTHREHPGRDRGGASGREGRCGRRDPGAVRRTRPRTRCGRDRHERRRVDPPAPPTSWRSVASCRVRVPHRTRPGLAGWPPSRAAHRRPAGIGRHRGGYRRVPYSSRADGACSGAPRPPSGTPRSAHRHCWHQARRYGSRSHDRDRPTRTARDGAGPWPVRLHRLGWPALAPLTVWLLHLPTGWSVTRRMQRVSKSRWAA